MSLGVHGTSLFASGRVVGNDYGAFQDILEQHPETERVVFINSPGGDLKAGMRIARLISAKELQTTVAGRCVSACAIMFMGGKERSFSDAFPPKRTYVGIHGPHKRTSKALSPQKSGEIYAFMESRMGERFNAHIIDMALYAMDDAGAMLRIYDAQRSPSHAPQHCISGKTPRKNCTLFTTEDALSLGVVTTRTLTSIELPAEFR